MAKHQRTLFDMARDELMSHIHRCGVLKASADQQALWLDDTMQYMAERYTQLSPSDLEELHNIGKRFCEPVIFRGEPTPDAEPAEDYEEGEMAGAA